MSDDKLQLKYLIREVWLAGSNPTGPNRKHMDKARDAILALFDAERKLTDERMTLTELARVLDQQLVIRYPDTSGNWFCSFEHGEVMERGTLSSPSGRGATPAAALFEYGREIEGKRMAFHAGSKERRKEFEMPGHFNPESTEKARENER